MNKPRFLNRLLVVFVLILMTASLSLAQEGDLPDWDDLEDGWNTIMPGGETTCAYGTDYEFHVHPADSDDLLVFFNGGGACWFGQICNPASPTFTPLADLPQNAPSPDGIFDMENEDNPFLNYNIVFIPYCTGDVHIGNNTMTYEIAGEDDEDEPGELTILHKGSVNSMTVLNWLFDNFDAPETIFVTGSSAGAIPSPLYAGIIADQYTDARIVQLGDGAGGYRSPDGITTVNTMWGVLDALPDWDAFADATVESLTFENYYVIAAERHPDIVFSQYNTAEDAVQYQFLMILGLVDVSLPELIMANYDDIRAGVDAFYTYTAGGDVHTILRLPEFYQYEVGGVRFRDWVAALAAGETVEDVMCEDCDNPPATE